MGGGGTHKPHIYGTFLIFIEVPHIIKHKVGTQPVLLN